MGSRFANISGSASSIIAPAMEMATLPGMKRMASGGRITSGRAAMLIRCSASSVSRQCGGSSRTSRGMPPAWRMIGR